MARILLLFALSFTLMDAFATGVAAEEEAAAEKPSPKVFVIKLTRLDVKDAASEAAAGLHGAQLEERIRKWRSEDQISSEESLSLTALEQFEATVQFGQRVAMVTGTTSSGGRTSRSSSWENTGTLLRARIVAQEDHVVGNFTYESSTVEPAEDEDSFGGVATTTFTTELRVKIGEPQVVAGSQADQQTVFFVEVTEVGPSPVSRRSSRIVPTAPRRPSPSRAPSPSGFGRPPSRAPRGSSSGSLEERHATIAAAIFRRFDKNEDGEIEQSEAAGLPGEFADYDADKNGKITSDEFVKHLSLNLRR